MIAINANRVISLSLSLSLFVDHKELIHRKIVLSIYKIRLKSYKGVTSFLKQKLTQYSKEGTSYINQCSIVVCIQN